MSHDTLDSLLRLRTKEVEDARLVLAEALAAEEQARLTRDAAEAAIVAETREAVRSQADYDVERFARWLMRGRTRLNGAETALAQAAAATAHRRAELALFRAAAEAVTEAIGRREQAAAAAAARTEQRELDEVGRGKHGQGP